MLILFFIIERFADFAISLFAPKFIPYLGLFAHPKTLLGFHLPRFLYSFANFDGIYYLRIAQNGYQQYEQAFFPFYPVLIRILSIFTKNNFISGMLISNICSLAGLLILISYLKRIKQKTRTIFLVAVLLLVFPTSFFLTSVYTEGLFFLLTILTFKFIEEKKLFPAAAIAFLAGLTRINGIILIVPFFIEFIRNFKTGKNLWKYAIAAIAPLLGLLTYMRFLLITTGDALSFFHSQSVFGPARSTKIILLPQVFYRYLKILLTAQPNLQYFISCLELIFFTFVFIVLILDLINNVKLKNKNYSLLSLNLFSLANILLPTLTGSFLSIPRFVLLAPSFFIYLGRLKKTWILFCLFATFIILRILLLSLFIQGYFVS